MGEIWGRNGAETAVLRVWRLLGTRWISTPRSTTSPGSSCTPDTSPWCATHTHTRSAFDLLWVRFLNRSGMVFGGGCTLRLRLIRHWTHFL